jgi:hypothetical protein
MNSGLHQSGTFFLFGAISLAASVWCYFYLKETSGGLTDKQKKSLYVPSDLVVELNDSPASESFGTEPIKSPIGFD